MGISLEPTTRRPSEGRKGYYEPRLHTKEIRIRIFTGSVKKTLTQREIESTVDGSRENH